MKIKNPFYQSGAKIRQSAQKIVKFVGKTVGLESFGYTPTQIAIINGSSGVDDPFKTIWIANVCGSLLAMNVAGLPTRLQDKDGEPIKDDGKVSTRSAMEKYKLLTRRPNFLYSGFDLLEMQTLQRIFHGNSYTRVIGLGASPKENPKELWPLFARSVTPTTNSKPLTPENLVFDDVSGGASEVWPYEEIVHVREPNDNSHIVGLPWTIAAGGKMKQILQLEDYEVNIFKNGAFPAINMHTEQAMTREQRGEYKKEFQEHQAGLQNAGAVLITANGLHASSMAFSPVDMEILASERLVLSIAATIFKTPAELLGPLMQQKNVTTYKSAFAQYYNSTLIPVGKKHYEEHSSAFWPNGEFEIVINESAIAAIQPETADLVSAYWLTPDQKRSMQGHAPTDDPLMKKFYLPSALMPIEDMGDAGGSNDKLQEEM